MQREFASAGPFRFYVNDYDSTFVLESVDFSEGRIVRKELNDSVFIIEPHFFIKDHLGSVRAVVKADGEILQQNDYQPFGEKILADGHASGENDYLYCGKEFQSFFDLPFYDSGARFQRNDGIFLSIDPLAEKYYSISPYAYCGGNPCLFIDEFGLAPSDTLSVNGGTIAPAVVFASPVASNRWQELLYDFVPMLPYAKEADKAWQNRQYVISATNILLGTGDGLLFFLSLGSSRSPKLLTTGARLTQEGMAHVLNNHVYRTILRKSRFKEGTNALMLQSMIQEAVKKGERIPASYNNNWIFTYDFKKIIGTSNGKPTSKIRVILDENYYLRSAYPIQ